MITQPKFFENFPDDNHCLQATVMMVLNTTCREVSWDEVNRMTEYEDGLYSWMPKATIALDQMIPGTKMIGGMDYIQFAKRGEEYFKEYNKANPQWFTLQKEHASPQFKKEQRAAQEVVQKNLIEWRDVSKEEIEQLLDDNLLIAVVNAGKLAEKDWSAGHFVLVYDQDCHDFILHDPGLPPREGWKVNKDKFINAFYGDLIMVPNK